MLEWLWKQSGTGKSLEKEIQAEVQGEKILKNLLRQKESLPPRYLKGKSQQYIDFVNKLFGRTDVKHLFLRTCWMEYGYETLDEQGLPIQHRLMSHEMFAIGVMTIEIYGGTPEMVEPILEFYRQIRPMFKPDIKFREPSSEYPAHLCTQRDRDFWMKRRSQTIVAILNDPLSVIRKGL